MADPFRSAWLKLGWGVIHARTLQNEIAEHAANVKPEDLFALRTEYDPKAHCIKTIVDSVQPPPADWSLHLGDVVNNFRACLDHVAWELVQRGSAWPLTRRQENSVYFPIADSRDRFEALCIAHLPGLRRADKAIIRKVQPYVGGKRNLWRHCLTPLPKMTSDDKHRELRPLWIAPEQGKIEYGLPATECIVTRVPQIAKRVVIEPEAEIQRIYVRKTGPNPHVDMKVQLSLKPIVDGPIWLDDWLAKTGEWLTALLWAFSKPPEELWSLGPGLAPVPHETPPS